MLFALRRVPFSPPTDPAWLEQRLVEHCVELTRAGTQPTMPLLGQFCINSLRLQMKVGRGVGVGVGGRLWQRSRVPVVPFFMTAAA